MIINIRGTSGSGKSTLVRNIMRAGYVGRKEVRIEGRKQPLGYELYDENSCLFVPGHYETECGGCDTISDNAMDKIYSLVREYHAKGFNVLFEGLLISAEANRMIQLKEVVGDDLHVIVLNTPIEQCLEGIRERQTRRLGAPKPLGPNTMKNLESKAKGALQCLKRFQAAGIKTHLLDREQAAKLVWELLKC